MRKPRRVTILYDIRLMPTSGKILNRTELDLSAAHWNLPTAQLVEHAIRAGEGRLVASGALAGETGQFTGRSPKDKFIVPGELPGSGVHGVPANQPMSSGHFAGLYAKALEYLQGRELYVQDCLAGADPA